MGISFKLSKGKRFRPGLCDEEEDTGPSSQRREKSATADIETASSHCEVDITEKAIGIDNLFPEHEVSFTLNLYPEGYSIQRPAEIDNCGTLLQDVKSLHPYDKASETLFSAIESGRLPGNILDDLPCKYLDGTLVCEVRDYRNCITEQGSSTSSPTVPILHKVQLRMSSENVVKDLPSISDDSWTYSDFLEAEAQILKSMQPCLCLDPSPALDRLCGDPTAIKLNLSTGKKRRLQQIPELTVTSHHQSTRKKICIESIPEFANCEARGIGTQIRNESFHDHENIAMEHTSSGVPSFTPNIFEQEANRMPLPAQSRLQPINLRTVSQGHAFGPPAIFSGVNTNTSSSQTIMGSYNDTVGSNLLISMKKRNLDIQLPPLGGINRQTKTTTRLDGIQQQLQQQLEAGNQFLDLSGTGLQWKNQLWTSQQDVKANQCSSTSSGQRYPSPVIKDVLNHQPGASLYFNPHGIRYGADGQIGKQELVRSKDTFQALESEKSALDPQQSQVPHLLLHSSMRNHPPNHVSWQNVQPGYEDMRKDDAFQRRKSVPTQQISFVPMVQSLVAREISSSSVSGEFSGVAMASSVVKQKDKLAAKTSDAVGKPNNPVYQQHQISGAMKCKPKSISKTVACSNIQTMETTPVDDEVILERFVKIDRISQRYRLNVKKNKVDKYPEREPKQFSTEKLASLLSDSRSAAEFTDQIKPMSGSTVCSKLNTYRARAINFMRDKEMECQGPMRLMLVEVPNDGTVALKHGYIDDYDTQDYEIYLPTTYHADLLASQFTTLMEQDGYQKTDDEIKPIQMDMAVPPSKLLPVFGMQSDRTSCDVNKPMPATCQPQDVAAPTAHGCMGFTSSSRDPPNNARMPTSANNSQAQAKPQGYFKDTAMPPRMQQVNQCLLQQQQQQQQQQPPQNTQSELHQQQKMVSSSAHMVNQPSHLMGQTSSLKMSANQMINNKPAPLQLQMLHQQALQQQQLQLPRKKMMGPNPTMNMAHVHNNMMNYTGGMHGISSLMGPISLGNINPQQMNLASASNFASGLHPTSFSSAQVAAAAITKFRMVHEQSGLCGQSGIAGMPELSSSSSLSMLGELSRPNMIPSQCKIPGTNMYINCHQLLQQQLRQQLQQQISCPMQQQMQYQMSSPMEQQMQWIRSPLHQQMQQQIISPMQQQRQHQVSVLLQQQMQHQINSPVQQEMQHAISLLQAANTTTDKLSIAAGNATLDSSPPSDNGKFFPPTTISMQQ